MSSYLTVDCNRTLKENQIITLAKYSDIKPPELQIHIDYLFPDGVSHHGNSYILNVERLATGVSEDKNRDKIKIGTV